MKNLFEKKTRMPLILGLALGAAAACAAVYFFRDELGELIDRFLDEDQRTGHAPDTQAYLHHEQKAPKTDREALRHHDILHGTDIHQVQHHEEQQSR